MHLVSVNMVDGVMVLMIVQDSAQIIVIFVHAVFEGFYFNGLLHCYNVLVRVFVSKSIAKGIGTIRDRLPIFDKKRWDSLHTMVAH